jgi:hypothetical protein
MAARLTPTGQDQHCGLGFNGTCTQWEWGLVVSCCIGFLHGHDANTAVVHILPASLCSSLAWGLHAITRSAYQRDGRRPGCRQARQRRAAMGPKKPRRPAIQSNNPGCTGLQAGTMPAQWRLAEVTPPGVSEAQSATSGRSPLTTSFTKASIASKVAASADVAARMCSYAQPVAPPPRQEGHGPGPPQGWQLTPVPVPLTAPGAPAVARRVAALAGPQLAAFSVDISVLV